MDRHDLRMFAAHLRESRPIRYSPIPVIEYHSPKTKGHVLAPSGSVMVYVTEKGSDLLPRIREAAAGKDTKIIDELYGQFHDRPLMKPYAAWRQLEASPVVADVRYGGRTLATNVFLPHGMKAVWFASPYNGGRLAPEELTLVEHVVEGSKSAYEAVAVKCTAPLTAAERAALDKVPVEVSEVNLAPNGACCDNVTDVLQVIIAATFAIMCGNPFPDLHIAEDTIKQMTPVATAIQLMNLRREALGHEH